ncbi:hypothetical protein [Flavobacterium sp. T12S277]|uniref:hypothetical protein n=1 Tax=Flavobacterium sp. T12S277 TaxID=3402752 RepID=UPI003AE383CB
MEKKLHMKFKITVPAGYQVKNYENDNLDINVVLENKEIFFATLFTTNNIKMLLERDESTFFWAHTMVILKDLKKETIKKFVQEAIDSESLEAIFYKIGNLGQTKGYPSKFEKITDFSNEPK